MLEVGPNRFHGGHHAPIVGREQTQRNGLQERGVDLFAAVVGNQTAAGVVHGVG